MTFTIGGVTLPADPGQSVALAQANVKSISQLKLLPILLKLGPRVPSVKLKGYIHVQGQSQEQLFDNYLKKYRDMIWKEAAYPRKIADDNQAAFWTWASSGGATAILSDVTDPCIKGKNALKIDITWNAATEGAAYHDYAPAKDFSKQDFVSVWLYGDNSSRLIKVRYVTAAWTDFFYYDVTVDWSGWKRLLLRKNVFSSTGSPDWSSINKVDYSINKQGAESGAVLYFDRHVVGVGEYVEGPDTRYDGVYLVKKFSWIESNRILNGYPYEMELWNEDDYY